MQEHKDVFSQVQETLVDSLGIDAEDVTLDAVLVEDLGAESIDFLDILFRLEKQFAITFPRGELFPEDILADAEYVQHGEISEEGIRLIQERMPFADVSPLAADPKVKNFSQLITVGTICNFIESRVASSTK